MSDTMRDAFEAWIAKDCGDLSKFGSGQNVHYSNSAVNNAWTGWQAAQSPPAPPVPSSVQEIMRLMMPYVDACADFENETIPRLRRISEDEVAATFAPLQSALTALVDDNHRLKFELDGVRAMRGPLTEERVKAIYQESFNSSPGAKRQAPNPPPLVIEFARAIEKAHGIEPEQGESHE